MTVFVYNRKVWKYHELPRCMYINLYNQYIIMIILDGGWSIYTLYSIGKQSPRGWLKYWPAGPWQLIFLVESAENHYCWLSKPVNIFIAMYIKDFILFMNFISVDSLFLPKTSNIKCCWINIFSFFNNCKQTVFNYK